MSSEERSEFIRLTGASREAMEKLDLYAVLLEEWNQKFNLVAPSTLPHIWSRHFLDSAQLMQFMPVNGTLADLGSGAGFPGLVLAILGKRDIHLIESTGKKAEFLKAVVEKLELAVEVHHARAEDMGGFKADIITARAVALLDELLKFANPLMRKDSLCLFLKGKNVDIELSEAKKHWTFLHEKAQSISDSTGTVLKIWNLRKNGPDRTKHRRN